MLVAARSCVTSSGKRARYAFVKFSRVQYKLQYKLRVKRAVTVSASVRAVSVSVS